ncbi:PTS mannose/fructose/sorbose family IIA subunit [Enterococcus sp. 669A]|uniref:PTS mannose/fructose/sorbose family IIA subunit n=1 Tax=Candidatus Enterococcus moelleringii TaxID=2815325 RepID=A0ABS3L9T0_9ENTE|nr:PTS mannose/fructose/sorbose family IIA subunit [Enterococcus sp. 669A]MBO1306388.1 PTS mannose/fructose/sorbose family IIA subunit [Enterococcus sp. 669A]
MIGIIVVAHDHLAEGLVETAQAIMGQQQHVDTIAVEAKAVNLQEMFDNKAKKMLEEVDEIVWLVDIFGGTPFRYASQCVVNNPKQHLVTGINLPMMLQALTNRDLPAASLTKQLEDESKEAIRRM